jgi:hypothetical protein
MGSFPMIEKINSTFFSKNFFGQSILQTDNLPSEYKISGTQPLNLDFRFEYRNLKSNAFNILEIALWLVQ